MLKVITTFDQKILSMDKKINKLAQQHYPAAQHLQQIPGVGNLIALAYVLIIDNPQRFAKNRDVGAYLGLVPRRAQSGATEKQLPISKAGNSLLRRLLVQAAQYILSVYGPDSDLKRYGETLYERGGKIAKKKGRHCRGEKTLGHHAIDVEKRHKLSIRESCLTNQAKHKNDHQ